MGWCIIGRNLLEDYLKFNSFGLFTGRTMNSHIIYLYIVTTNKRFIYPT